MCYTAPGAAIKTAAPTFYASTALASREVGACVCSMFLFRGNIVNRTYGTHKNLYIFLYLLPMFGPVNYVVPRK